MDEIFDNIKYVENMIVKELVSIGYKERDLIKLNDTVLIIEKLVSEFNTLKKQNIKLKQEKDSLMEVLMSNINDD